jgi:putative ABC transport system ATP-binding protein
VTPVLRGLTFEVGQGEIVFLVGPSGSGKSTLLSIVGCILTPDEGTMHIAGRNVTALNGRLQSQIRLEQIGFMFQRFHLIRGLSAAENVTVPLTLAGASQAKARKRAVELLKAVGLPDKIDADPRNMSVGQCQRVALARALAHDPDIILADEPTASLDAEYGSEIMKLIRQLVTNEGKTAVIVSHDARIFQYADRVLHLDNGRLTDGDDDTRVDEESLAVGHAQ